MSIKDRKMEVPGLGSNSSALVEVRVGGLKNHPRSSLQIQREGHCARQAYRRSLPGRGVARACGR